MATGQKQTKPVALSVAGSDSSGGAGIQADLRTFARIGAFGTTAITAITAQNLRAVRKVLGVGPSMVRAQIEAVFDQWDVAALKTGMLFDRATVDAVVDSLEGYAGWLVIDPVMVATSGAALLEPDALTIYRERLAPLATVITPNLPEASVMLGDDSLDRKRPEDVAKRIRDEWAVSVLLKGGHREGPPVDVLCTKDGVERRFAHDRVSGVNSHGTGCILSAAIAAYLAHDPELEKACQHGIEFVHRGLVDAALVGEARLVNIEGAAPSPSA